jgi:hypothetical protein
LTAFVLRLDDGFWVLDFDKSAAALMSGAKLIFPTFVASTRTVDGLPPGNLAGSCRAGARAFDLVQAVTR